ncbi:MAG: PhzF family phenazine biosynthesis protein [Phycisphaerales bacterium]
MKLKLLQIDAFTSAVFKGNPAAVVPLDAWLADETMQAIALENNLSETAFFVPSENASADFHLRWFTPALEVALCGHATLASAHALWNHLGHAGDTLRFSTTRSGVLRVTRDDDLIVLDFPAYTLEPADISTPLVRALGRQPTELFTAGPKLLAVFENKRDVIEMEPDFRAVADLGHLSVIVTAPGAKHDFVSRFFAPHAGIDEDPVTGSAHCALAPYWSQRLGRKELSAHQVSKRGGVLRCVDHGDRVHVAGHATTYLEGQITIPD